MAITASSTKANIEKIIQHLATMQVALNAADANLGDGDTGLMIARLFEAFGGVDCDGDTNLGDYLLRLAQVGARSTGSSFGTLIIAALMSVARETGSRKEVALTETGRLVEIARDAMMARGKTPTGSKTVIDSLDRIARALKNGDLADGPALIARSAAFAALSEFKFEECKIGRARVFSSKSKGLDDPGMLAVALALDAIA